MNKYVFTYFNGLANEQQLGFVLADNLKEAKQNAILYIRFYTYSMDVDEDTIDMIEELDDDLFLSIDDIKKLYIKCGRDFNIPDINDEEEDE